MIMKVPMEKCTKKLAILWFISVGFLLLVLILQTLLGRYGEGAKDVWEWFLPTVLPTLCLIGGVFRMDTSKKIKEVDRFVYRLSFFSSAFYLLTIYLVFFLQPFSILGPIEMMKQANLGLSPLQGIVAALTGRFFVKGEQNESTSSDVT